MRKSCFITVCFTLAALLCEAALTSEELAKEMQEGSLLYLSECVYHDKAPQSVDISADVEGLSEISLITWTAGDNSSNNDYADWIDLRFEGAQTVYLSDIPWEFAWTLCGTQWRCTTFEKTDVRKNLSAMNTDLKSQGKKYNKGLGVMSPSLVVYKVPQGAKKLVAKGMVDDVVLTFSNGKKASAQFIVLAGLPDFSLVKQLRLPQVLPAEQRKLAASLHGKCNPALIRDYEGMWKSLLLNDLVYEQSVSKEERNAQAVNKSATILKSDRDPLDIVLRRTAALYEDLATSVKLKTEGKHLKALQDQALEVDVAKGSERTALYLQACALRRQIAFKNPVLKGIDQLLFNTREVLPPEEMYGGCHMADQFFGFNATIEGTADNGGLYVLDQPFSDKAVVRNLIKDSVIESGAMKGRKLGRGGYLSPDVSYNGKEILFAYTKGAYGERAWNEESVFHIFKCNADGSRLVQLTDGSFNDFDPCWLPNGRIAFISERRRGFGRCHPRTVPNFTLHSMFEDGTDITRLSSHETNEWQPSVNQNGMILYTRWDYVDRGFSQAHHIWTTTPDGRDSREVNGNSHLSLRTAPMFIGDARSIPGTGKYMAIGAGHHTEVRGSVLVIDPSIPDDNVMAQIRRFTPDHDMPEAEIPLQFDKASGVYATPWPLSENYVICVYDPLASSQFGYTSWRDRHYSIVLMDVFGNKIPLYTDPGISCLSPMPLQAREKPPVRAHLTLVGRPRLPNGDKPEPIDPVLLPKTAKVGVVNVYDSRYPFPKGTKIKELRIWQVLPKVAPIVNNPRIGLGDQKSGRQCLGSVPVEEDGSAFFEVPVNSPILFHAVDDKGIAIQGMRSVTYTAPGETLMCNGCHEQRVGVQQQKKSSAMPIAMQRAPSKLKPEPSGSNPYSYPRLVQPVFEKNCVSCHGGDREKGMPDLRKGDYHKDKDHFFTSIRSLQKHVFHYGAFFNYIEFEEPSTYPGKFGAYRSPLYKMLVKGHHDVNLSDEDMRRIVLFIESNASFLGHDVAPVAQAEGWIVYPTLY
ncbi:MAG: NPCBM/NEW2 domain-containing protein [Kiritimatiellae bacterium]|jgi:hypothetical protein|nr:NPCBM/NEW2 domain-containing protein [Kiritimatiellia bacterium]